MSDISFLINNPIIKRRSKSITRILDGRAFVVEKKEGRPVRLNPLGTQIWQLLETPRRASDLIDFICGQYEIDPKEAAKDLELFLIELIHKNLIEPGNEKDENTIRHSAL